MIPAYRVTEQTYRVDVSSTQTSGESVRQQLPFAPMLYGKTISSIVSYPGFNGFFGNQVNCYMTLKNRRNETLMYRFPLIETWSEQSTLAAYNSRRPRMFRLYDVDLSKSYIEVSDFGGTINIGQPFCSILFYTGISAELTAKTVKEL